VPERRYPPVPLPPSPHPQTPHPPTDPPARAQVYHQEVTRRLQERQVASTDDIEWLRVLRFYVEGNVVGGGQCSSLKIEEED
jgi:hypothetical protein